MRPTELIISAFGPYAGEVTPGYGLLGTGTLSPLRATPEQARPPWFDAIAFAPLRQRQRGQPQPRMLRSKYARPDARTYVEMGFSL